jgi:hypothetical protein
MPGTNSPIHSNTEQKKAAKPRVRRERVSQPRLVSSLSLSPAEMRLIHAYRQLSDDTQGIVVDMTEMYSTMYDLKREKSRPSLVLVHDSTKQVAS